MMEVRELDDRQLLTGKKFGLFLVNNNRKYNSC